MANKLEERYNSLERKNVTILGGALGKGLKPFLFQFCMLCTDYEINHYALQVGCPAYG